MKITSKGIYGISALIDLGVYGGEGAVKISSIAQRQNLSPKYLEQTIPLLKKAKIVKSILGPNGGYLLAKAPKEISLKVVIEALEGEITVIAEKNEENGLAKNCMKKLLWEKLDHMMIGFLLSMSLQDLIDQYNQENMQAANMFYI